MGERRREREYERRREREKVYCRSLIENGGWVDEE